MKLKKTNRPHLWRRFKEKKFPRDGRNTERAFQKWVAELVHYLALPRHSQIAESGNAASRLATIAAKTADRYSYLLRIGRALAFEGLHRELRKVHTQKAQKK